VGKPLIRCNVVNSAQGDFAMLGAFSMVVLCVDLELPDWLGRLSAYPRGRPLIVSSLLVDYQLTSLTSRVALRAHLHDFCLQDEI
jgi:hypothetical protein